MPTPTYTALATVTLGTAASSITFSSIPATYRDLVLVGDYAVSANGEIQISLNGSTADRSRVLMYGVPAEAGSTTGSNINFAGGYTGNRSIGVAQFMDYSATDKHKAILLRTQTASSPTEVVATSARWASTSAITSIGLNFAAGTLSVGTTFSLYGIVA
jgi:hypothetical protein